MWDVQLLTIGAITFLAVISPGPDFAVILRNSVSYGRSAGLATALGITSGVSIHVSYTLFGFSYIINEASWLLEVMRYLGAAYLIWLGVTSLLSKSSGQNVADEAGMVKKLPSFIAFRNGFICNALNPKTALFFIAFFTQIVDPQTPLSIQVGFGVFVSLAHLAWFSFVACFLSHAALKGIFEKSKIYIEKVVGTCLLGLGLKIVAG